MSPQAIEREPRIRIVREEVTTIDEANEITIIATGPLTSDALADEIERLSVSPDNPTARLYFYDSISPIVEADSIDHVARSTWPRATTRAPPTTSTVP